jgi:hypothetical protein
MILASSTPARFVRLQAAFLALILLAAGIAAIAQGPARSASTDLHAGFLHPADDARPLMRWWWFGPAVVKPELEKELTAMKNAGIGGVEIQPVYPMMLDDEASGIKNLKYMSPEFLDAVSFANATAHKLGLRVDITLGSGWPYGGPSTTLALAAGRLKIETEPVAGSTAPTPRLDAGDSLVAAFVVKGSAKSFDAASAVRFDPAGAVPAGGGERTALYFIAGHTRQAVKRAAYGAEGFVLDHMARAAIDEHLQDVATPLVKAFGDQPPYSVFSDSLEVYGADWTPNLPAEFQKRRGYDLIPHLPELLAGGTPQADAIRHDWGVTMSDLVRENYLEPLTRFAVEHKTKFRSQTYGYPAVTLADEATATLPEGEGPQWRSFSFTRWASSANHLYGNHVTSAETWTWLHSPAFRATPLDMKVEADRMFILGVNQFVGHGFPYSPPAAGEPGWSLYAAAVFNSHNPWFTVMPDITAYLTRISWLLRQGKPANDVAILLPEDDAQAAFKPIPGAVAVTEEMKTRIAPELMAAILDAGYNIDYIDAMTIDKLGSIPYPVLVIPPTERIPLKTYRTIESYAAGLGKVIAVGPQASLAPGFEEQDQSAAVAALSQKLFHADGHKGIAIDSSHELGAALHAALKPDVDTAGQSDRLGFIHRKLDTSDVYFVVNSSNKPMDTAVAFRAARPIVEAWDPDSGKVLFAAAYKPGTRLRLKLAPYESRVFVLNEKSTEKLTAELAQPKENDLADLSRDWSIRFGGDAKPQPLKSLSSWTEIEGRKFYSGEAAYTRSFSIDARAFTNSRILIDFGLGVETTDPRPPGSNGVRALLDPPLREAAIVLVNGVRVGSLWHPPYRLDVTRFVHPGANTVEVRVANTAINRMAGDPPRDFTALYAKYGKRFEMQDMDNLMPIPSGMMGPVRLIVARR